MRRVAQQKYPAFELLQTRQITSDQAEILFTYASRNDL